MVKPNLLQQGYMQVASMGLSLGSYENVEQNNNYKLQLVESLGNALHFVGMKCLARHTFAPIDSTCSWDIKIGQWEPQGSPRLVTADPEGRSNFLFLYIGLSTFQLGQWRPNYPPLYPGMVTVGPGRRPNCSLMYRCVYRPGGRFPLANKNPGVRGADVWISLQLFVTHFSIFSLVLVMVPVQ